MDSSFREFVEEQVSRVQSDAGNDEAQAPTNDELECVTISNLFDFEAKAWVDAFARSSIRSFEEELELYEMLDLDAEGEEDIDLNVDETTEDILAG